MALNSCGMKIETWMDRITSESNLWLNALKLEDGGNYHEAFFLYLKDAEESLKQHALIRAALSCSCAANCLTMTADLASASNLYLRTAMIYETNGDMVIGESVRETLWSYQEAFEYYHLACQSDKAQIVYDKYVSLARKINPFLGEEEAMKSLRFRNESIKNLRTNQVSSNIQISTQITNAMEIFLLEVDSVYGNKSGNAVLKMFTKTRGIKSEKSSIN